MDRTARTAHERAGQPRERSHPRPEIACRRAEPTEIPRTAEALRRLLAGLDWRVSVTCSRGTMTRQMHGVRVERVVDVIAVRARSPEGVAPARGVRALWVDGKAEHAWLLTPDAMPRKVNISIVKPWVLGERA